MTPGLLAEKGILNKEQQALLVEMAGYRNRLVDFYQEVEAGELFHIAGQGRTDIKVVLEAVLSWIKDHPELLDRS
jgi:uncharacterized protein YutE (UPF0331/DUF86 family)